MIALDAIDHPRHLREYAFLHERVDGGSGHLLDQHRAQLRPIQHPAQRIDVPLPLALPLAGDDDLAELDRLHRTALQLGEQLSAELVGGRLRLVLVRSRLPVLPTEAGELLVAQTLDDHRLGGTLRSGHQPA